MKIVVINGGPRKNGNTMTLCHEFLKGAKAAAGNIQAEVVHLYELRYTGCQSCFACKRAGGSSYGKCAVKDELSDVLSLVANADCLVIGSPIYFGEATGQLRSFLERLLFPFHTYENGNRSVAPKKMPVYMIYTMNVTEEQMKQYGYAAALANLERVIAHVFTRPIVLYGFNTYQFSDYSQYRVEIFSESAKAAYRRERFPMDCLAAYECGRKAASV